MPIEDESFGRAMRDLARQVEKGAKVLHPIQQSELDTVRAAIQRKRLEDASRTGRSSSSRNAALIQFLRRPIGIASVAATLMLASYFGWQLTIPTLDFPDGFDPDQERGGPTSVPRHLRWQPRNDKIQLLDGDDRMAGATTATNSPPGVLLYLVELRAKGSHPAQANFAGLLWVTNAPGVSVIRNRTDQTGMLLKGVYQRPGFKPQSVTLCFLP